MKTNHPTPFAIAAVLLMSTGLSAQESKSPSSNLALTPPMGWNSWNKFACNVSEDMIRSMADAMVKSGMKDAGYEYVNIDDCCRSAATRKGTSSRIRSAFRMA
jgi:alpha-galactosidase